MFSDNDREVAFDIYCPLCQYEKRSENRNPCNECIALPINIDSQKPTMWKPKTSRDDIEDEFTQEELKYLKGISHIFEV